MVDYSIVKANCPDCMSVVVFKATSIVERNFDVDVFLPPAIVTELDGKSERCSCQKMITLTKNSAGQLDTTVKEGSSWG